MDLAIDEVTTISSIIQEAAGEEAEIIFGAVHDGALQEEVRVTVIATGMDRAPAARGGYVSRPPRPQPRPTAPLAPPTKLPDPNDLSIPTFIRKQTRT
jgi:cell division protein FtsZ